MSGKIVVLPEALTHKIAAGEVIERPASIVKELLENALDAGATDVRVELTGGGCGSIRVSDNGGGIDPSDVPKAFERYATSKIYEFDDIYRVETFGFRGEALPSIASIARVEMITRKRDRVSGTRIVVSAGRIEEISDAGSPDGSTITVSRIFDPVPVRRKFLKSEATEQGSCVDVITRTALSCPSVRIQVMAGGREILKIPSTADASERIALILGADFTDHLAPVEATEGGVRISGFLSGPDYTRSNSRNIYCYVNRRYIRDYLLNHAIMTAYRNVIAAKRYPAAVLSLTLPPEEVDVNVHPAKMEVRFRRPREIYRFVVESAGRTLSGAALSAGKPTAFAPPVIAAQLSGYRERVEEALKRYTLSTGRQKLRFGASALPGRPDVPPDAPGLPEIAEASPSLKRSPFAFANLAFIGSFAGTYLLFSGDFSGGEHLVMLDQHAAHERILFERFAKSQEGEKIPGQRLLIPEVIHLTPKNSAALQDVFPVFERAGIELEPFSGDSVVLRSVPANLGHEDVQIVVRDALDAFSESGRTLSLQERQDEIIRLMACRGAVKANQSLGPAEVAALCADLDRTPFSATCPHGRPVYVVLDRKELEKMFKRR